MALLELSENPRNELLNGIVLIVTGVSIMSLQDAFIKLVSGRYPLYEIMVIRTLFAIGPVLCMVHWEGGLRLLRTGRPGLHLLRGFAFFWPTTAISQLWLPYQWPKLCPFFSSHP
jgi:hypothetical protein